MRKDVTRRPRCRSVRSPIFAQKSSATGTWRAAPPSSRWTYVVRRSNAGCEMSAMSFLLRFVSSAWPSINPVASVAAGHLAHLALDKLPETVGLAGRRRLERERQSVRRGQDVCEPVARPRVSRVAQEGDALAALRNAQRVVDDVPFAVGVERARAVRGVGVDDHQVVVREGGAVFRGRVLRVVPANQNLPLQALLEGEIP